MIGNNFVTSSPIFNFFHRWKQH